MLTTILASIALGLLIGAGLGALGGGGSILTVPALVYLLGESAQQATTGSLVIVGITSLVGALGHARSGHVRWAAGAAFGVTGIVASWVGTTLNRSVDPNVLMLAFAALMLVSAAGMIRRARRNPAAGDRAEPAANTLSAARIAKFVVAGPVVGFLTGFVGVGGGFVIVPALVMALDFPMATAVGTSLLAITINSATALAARAGHVDFDLSVIVPFTAAAILGSLIGTRAAARTPQATLTRAFAALLLLVAAYVAVRSAITLA